MAADSMALSLAARDAGTLGGRHGCGLLANTATTVCLAIDHAGVVIVLVEGSTDPAADSLRLREAIEKRPS